jgi:invasion protein IalB
MIRRSLLRRVTPALLAILMPFAAAFAADETPEPALEGLYSDWSLYRLEENGNSTCYLASNLERSSDNVPRRRPAYVLITNRPAEGRKEIVSVAPGYSYAEGDEVLMTVGHKQFHMVAARGSAWAADNEDPQIVAAIRSGSTLVVTGRVKDGPTTTDVFSLKGFGPALAALDRACPVAPPAPATARRKHARKNS